MSNTEKIINLPALERTTEKIMQWTLNEYKNISELNENKVLCELLANPVDLKFYANAYIDGKLKLPKKYKSLLFERGPHGIFIYNDRPIHYVSLQKRYDHGDDDNEGYNEIIVYGNEIDGDLNPRTIKYYPYFNIIVDDTVGFNYIFEPNYIQLFSDKIFLKDSIKRGITIYDTYVNNSHDFVPFQFEYYTNISVLSTYDDGDKFYVNSSTYNNFSRTNVIGNDIGNDIILFTDPMEYDDGNKRYIFNFRYFYINRNIKIAMNVSDDIMEALWVDVLDLEDNVLNQYQNEANVASYSHITSHTTMSFYYSVEGVIDLNDVVVRVIYDTNPNTKYYIGTLAELSKPSGNGYTVYCGRVLREGIEIDIYNLKKITVVIEEA